VPYIHTYIYIYPGRGWGCYYRPSSAACPPSPPQITRTFLSQAPAKRGVYVFLFLRAGQARGPPGRCVPGPRAGSPLPPHAKTKARRGRKPKTTEIHKHNGNSNPSEQKEAEKKNTFFGRPPAFFGGPHGVAGDRKYTARVNKRATQQAQYWVYAPISLASGMGLLGLLGNPNNTSPAKPPHSTDIVSHTSPNLPDV
jgi:hypothetical protein